MSEITPTPGFHPNPPGINASKVQEQTISLYKKQEKIHPRSVSGWFTNWRWVLVWVTQLIFYGLPWLSWNNRQAVLFDLGARRFYIFDLILYPQDFIYLTGLLIISAYSLFLFTAIGGRLWCGYACPQSVYTEIFMWVERRVEGDRYQRLKLDKATWGWDKIWRKTTKQAIWILIGLWTGFTFVGYFTPIHILAQETLAFSLGAWQIFWILFYGFATYGNAGYMREQVCKYMCPYARFQSAMFDKDTLIITYDAQRGEPRGSRSKKVDPKAQGLGACVDCSLCVQVCPTGIDIRKGLQYECIGCAACIDACNGVMDKMNYPRGLIRYDTENRIKNNWTTKQTWLRVFRPRVLIYSAILIIIVIGFFTSLLTRTPFRVDIVRDRNVMARMVEDGRIENVYRLQIMNATELPQRYTITVKGLAGAVIESGNKVTGLGPAESKWLAVSVQIPPEVANQVGQGTHPISFEIHRLEEDQAKTATLTEPSTFIIPR